MVSALYGGLFTGLVTASGACLMAILGWRLFVDQPFIKDTADWLGLVAFWVNCLMISGVAEESRCARVRANRPQRAMVWHGKIGRRRLLD